MNRMLLRCRVLLLIFISLGYCFVQAEPDKLRDEDYFPFPWSVQCPIKMSELEGDWTIKEVFEASSKTSYETKNKLGGFRFSDVTEDQSGAILFTITKYDVDGEETDKGHGIINLPTGEAIAIMSSMRGSKNKVSAWVFVYAYAPGFDNNSNDLACASNQLKRAITMMPKIDDPSGSIHFVIEPAVKDVEEKSEKQVEENPQAIELMP